MIVEPSWFLWGLALPAAIAAVGVILLGRLMRSPQHAGAALGWAIGLPLALAVGYLATFGPPRWPPNTANHWLLVAIVPATAAVGVLAALVSGRRRTGDAAAWAARALLACAIPPLLLRAFLRYHWSTGEAVAWLIGLPLLGLAAWFGMHRLAARRPGPAIPFVLAGTALGLAGATVASGSITLGQLTAVLAAAALGGWIGGLVVPDSGPRRVGLDASFALLFALLINDRFYTETMSDAVALLVLVAPLTMWLAELPRPERLGAKSRTALRVLVPAGVVALAVALAGYQSLEPESDAPADDAGSLYEGL